MRLSWKGCCFRCRPQLVLTTWFRVVPADVSATSCDVRFFFSVSYVVSLTNCRHVVVVTTHYVPCTPCVSDLDQETGTNLHTQERNERFSTLQLLASSVWRHLSHSCFCHVLVGAAQKNAYFPPSSKKYICEHNTKHNHTTHNNQHEPQLPYPPAACPLSLHG